MQYDIKLTPEALKAAATWAMQAGDMGGGADMTDVGLLVDDRMLIAYQGDEHNAWDTDGGQASEEYLALCPLDRPDAKPAPYRVERQYAGVYHVLDEDGERVGRVGKFMPGPMVSYDGPKITAPAHARAIAQAMTALANELEGMA